MPRVRALLREALVLRETLLSMSSPQNVSKRINMTSTVSPSPRNFLGSVRKPFSMSCIQKPRTASLPVQVPVIGHRTSQVGTFARSTATIPGVEWGHEEVTHPGGWHGRHHDRQQVAPPSR